MFKTEPLPVECVVRGYLAGSGWKDYRSSGSVCGIALPEGLRESERLDPPLFTPSTKAEVGHDENISFAAVEAALAGQGIALLMRKDQVIFEADELRMVATDGRRLVLAKAPAEKTIAPMPRRVEDCAMAPAD